MADLYQGAPLIIEDGIEDNSPVVLAGTEVSEPQHTALCYLFTQKGPVGRHFLDLRSQSAGGVYGDKTFVEGTPYYNHSTEFAKAIIGEGNSVVVHRVLGKGATDVANVTLYLDVLEAEVPVYERHDTGTLKYNELGEPVAKVDGEGKPVTTKGYKVCWVADSERNQEIGQYIIGARQTRVGIQQGEDGTQSTQYPIFEFSARDVGSYGNNVGIRIWSQVKGPLETFPDHLLDVAKTYPINFAVVNVEDKNSGVIDIKRNNLGSANIQGVLQLNAVNPATKGNADLGRMLSTSYENVSAELSSGLGQHVFYHENIDALVTKFYEAEAAIEDDTHDFPIIENDVENNKYAINIINFVNSTSTPYHALQLVDVKGSVRLTQNTNVFFDGGYDGEMTLEHLEKEIVADVKQYGDPLSPYGNIAKHVETVLYDSGFTIETKLEMAKFIALRKDNFVIFGTSVHGKNLSIEEQRSLAITLNTQLALTPESAFYSTPVVRAMIVMGSGRLLNSNYQYRMPLTYEIARKSARLMGAANGYWRRAEIFDKGDASVLKFMTDVDVDFIPSVSRADYWSNGINFPQSYDTRSVHFPGLRTVYKNETSVLVSYFVAFAAAYCSRVAHRVGREFQGDITLSNGVLVDEVNKRFTSLASDRFGDIVTVVPRAELTEADVLRGFSWHLPIDLYGRTMKRVMRTSVHANRLQD